MQLFPDRFQVIQDDAVLNHNVRLVSIVAGIEVVAEHRPCIYTLVDPQHRHPDSAAIAVPAVFRTDSRMHYERAFRGNRKYRFLQQRLAPGDHDVRPPFFYETLRLLGIWRMRHQDRNIFQRRIDRAQLFKFLLFPAAILPRQEQPVVQAKRQDVDKPQGTDSLDFRGYAAARPLACFAQDDLSDQF